MQTAYINLIKYALANGCTVSVWDGEEWQVKKSTSFKEINEAVKSVEVATLRIRDEAGAVLGVAVASAYGLEPDETLIDWTDNDWFAAWEKQYDALIGA